VPGARRAPPPGEPPAAFELVDVAGLVRGASKGEGLGNRFLADVREADAILHVVRCFEDRNVIHVSDRLDPVADIETVTSELVLANLESLTRKPTLFVCNVAESDLARADELPLVRKVRDRAARQGSETLAISARLEAELAGVPDEEVKARLASHGIGEPQSGRLIRAAYELAATARPRAKPG